MHIVQQVLFVIIASIGIYLFAKNMKAIRRNILLGKKSDVDIPNQEKWRNLILNAFGQKKMFSNPLVAILHLFVYLGFIIINIEIIEIILDGISGQHRLFANLLGGLYPILINSFEILAFLVLVSVIVFLARRNFMKVKRLNQGELLSGWPRKDANYILYFEIVLMSLFLMMNAADSCLQDLSAAHYTHTGEFAISQFLKPLLSSLPETALIIIERFCWWAHIIGIFVFMNYLPYSKHLHVIMAFPNSYYANVLPQGKMNNMPEIQKEVLYMMQPELAPTSQDAAAPMNFGAKDIFDLSWKNLMDAYSCTECGRCSAACPANMTGKKLSPRKIMMSTRDRLEEVGKNIDKNKEFIADEKHLLHDYITAEELRACTTCNACVEACPVSISPLDIIIQLRRNLVMEESNAPQEWNMMFGNIENNMAPWKFSPEDRDAWTIS
jgi:heterodisulfide reductase subunit C